MLTKTLSTSAALSPPGLPFHTLKNKRERKQTHKQNNGVVTASSVTAYARLEVGKLKLLPALTHAEPDSYEIHFMDEWATCKQKSPFPLISSLTCLSNSITPKSHVTLKHAGEETWDSNEATNKITISTQGLSVFILLRAAHSSFLC